MPKKSIRINVKFCVKLKKNTRLILSLILPILSPVFSIWCIPVNIDPKEFTAHWWHGCESWSRRPEAQLSWDIRRSLNTSFRGAGDDNVNTPWRQILSLRHGKITAPDIEVSSKPHFPPLDHSLHKVLFSEFCGSRFHKEVVLDPRGVIQVRYVGRWLACASDAFCQCTLEWWRTWERRWELGMSSEYRRARVGEGRAL